MHLIRTMVPTSMPWAPSGAQGFDAQGRRGPTQGGRCRQPPWPLGSSLIGTMNWIPGPGLDPGSGPTKMDGSARAQIAGSKRPGQQDARSNPDSHHPNQEASKPVSKSASQQESQPASKPVSKSASQGPFSKPNQPANQPASKQKHVYDSG